MNGYLQHTPNSYANGNAFHKPYYPMSVPNTVNDQYGQETNMITRDLEWEAYSSYLGIPGSKGLDSLHASLLPYLTNAQEGNQPADEAQFIQNFINQQDISFVTHPADTKSQTEDKDIKPFTSNLQQFSSFPTGQLGISQFSDSKDPVHVPQTAQSTLPSEKAQSARFAIGTERKFESTSDVEKESTMTTQEKTKPSTLAVPPTQSPTVAVETPSTNSKQPIVNPTEDKLTLETKEQPVDALEPKQGPKSWAQIAIKKTPTQSTVPTPSTTQTVPPTPATTTVAAPQATPQASKQSEAKKEDPIKKPTYNPSLSEFNVHPASARFFVIKSFSEDDIHKSIKFNVWASTDNGNKKLDAAFKASHAKGPIYLFFSVNASGQFCGMAQMMTPLDYETKCEYWLQDKWNGLFQVKWIFIKDVPNAQLRHIRLENNENKPVTNSRDTQEIPFEQGKEVLKIFASFKAKTSILDDFSFYDKRQEELIEKREPNGSEKPTSTQNGHKSNVK